MHNATPPSCFGSYWEGSDVRCAGGLDPLFTDPETESNRRERCTWYAQCEKKTKSTDVHGGSPQVIPPQNLMRPPPHVTTSSQPTAAVPRDWQGTVRHLAMAMQTATPRHQAPPTNAVFQPQPAPVQYPMPPAAPVMQAQHPYAPYGQMVPPQMAMMPHMVPMNYVMQGAQVPGFLTVPEPVYYGEHWSKRLAASVFRGVIKSLGLILANFFDHTPMSPYAPPAPPPPPPPQPPAPPAPPTPPLG